ncbi:DUF3368 domain-containing protein [Pontibacter sp. G13]|uniref:DUF3368 domain-containing protein n=1 Tax=Pontibacter sp. G13 TaxID=3074898 RepID=UPI0028899E28|nr:DUF3368 domain-containing protein [Pontibacter sp. G13]WNJ20296.1 DUF3368 domain-containing protein [Pontibacter sp. G13]
MPENLIVSDSSPLIALLDIGYESVLKDLYDRILISDIVRAEIHAEIPEWIEVSDEYDIKQFKLLSLHLDEGEASAIALAMAFPKGRILIDERKGRKVATNLDLRVTGTIGILIKAKEKGLIDSGRLILEKLENHGFWLSSSLKDLVLQKMGE